MKSTKLRAIVLLVASAAFLFACNKGGEGGDAKTDEATAGGAPKAGGSCKGMSASSGAIACEGNDIIFCSSYSDYKWKKQRTCAAGAKCVPAPDGKAASCK